MLAACWPLRKHVELDPYYCGEKVNIQYQSGSVYVPLSKNFDAS
jgi:hypothetical protein